MCSIRRRPYLNAGFAKATHFRVKFSLIATICLDVTRIAAHNDAIEELGYLEELIMLFVDIMQQFAAHAGHDHAIRNGNGVVAMAVRAFVGATELL